VTNIRDQLRRRLRADGRPETADETGQEDADGGDRAENVVDAQSADRPVVAPPTPSHVPDAARSFDPWGIRTSTS
jgi:hypothetical protein